MSKSVYVFLFTDWHLKGNAGHGKPLSEWPPFSPTDRKPIGMIIKRVNQRVEKILPSDFPLEERIYLEHSSCGIELIGQDNEPNWEVTWGTIIDHPVSISSKENDAKLGKMLAGLTRQPKSGGKNGRPPAEVFVIPPNQSNVPAPLLKYGILIQEFNVENSEELSGIVSGRLAALAQTVFYASRYPNIPPDAFPILEKGF